MVTIGHIIDGIFDGLVRPLARHPAWAMVAISVITAVWALLLFKAVTPQKRLVAARDRLTGHIFEMGLYQDHLSVVGRIQRDLARANLRYLSLSLPALLALTIPMVVTLAQLDSRFAHRPLQARESAVFTVTLAPEQAARLDDVELVVPDDVEVEAGPVRDHDAGRAAWRLGPLVAGQHELQVTLDGAEIARRTLPASGGLERLNERSTRSWFAPVLAPGAPPLPRDGALATMTLRLPPRRVSYLGIELPWLVAFMILSLVAGLLLKNALRVSL
jgi:hypothetical protein